MKYDTTPIKDCPFCGTAIPAGQWDMTYGYKRVRCSCGANAPIEKWNHRQNTQVADLERKLADAKRRDNVAEAIAFGKGLGT
jgi:hypothetical protein